MSTVTGIRADVTPGEVAEILRQRLGSDYKVTPSMTSVGFGKQSPAAEDTMHVRRNWLQQANVQVVHHNNATELHVSPGATYFGLIRLVQRVGLTRAIHDLLAQAPELSEAG